MLWVLWRAVDGQNNHECSRWSAGHSQMTYWFWTINKAQKKRRKDQIVSCHELVTSYSSGSVLVPVALLLCEPDNQLSVKWGRHFFVTVKFFSQFYYCTDLSIILKTYNVVTIWSTQQSTHSLPALKNLIIIKKSYFVCGYPAYLT